MSWPDCLPGAKPKVKVLRGSKKMYYNSLLEKHFQLKCEEIIFKYGPLRNDLSTYEYEDRHERKNVTKTTLTSSHAFVQLEIL